MDYNTRLREASREILERRIIDDVELKRVADKYNLPLSTVKTLSTFYFHDTQRTRCAWDYHAY